MTPQRQNTRTRGNRAGSADAKGHNGHDTQPEWWLALQWADVTDTPPEWPIHDEVGVAGSRELRDLMRDQLGVTVEPLTTFKELRVVPADFAGKHAETTLTRAQIAAYAAEHGLEDPHVIAERLARECDLKAEQERQRVRELFIGAPLPLTVTRLPPFPVHALPPVLAEMVAGVADELGIDPAMTAAFGLGAISGALGGRVVVQVYGNWFENGVSYIVVVAESGDRKSPALKAMLSDPLAAVEMAVVEDCWVVPLTQLDPDDEFMVVDGEEEFHGPAPRLTASDVTTEQLAVLMEQNDEHMVIADAEGDVFDTLSGRYSALPSLTLYLQAYSRERVRVDRVGRPPVMLNNPALTLCLATQPDVWYPVMSDPRFSGKGLIARIEVAFPEPRKERMKRLAGLPASECDDDEICQTPVSPQVIAAYRRMIRELALGVREAGVTTARLTEEAQLLMKRHTLQIDARSDDDGDLGGKLSRWAAKCSGRVVRLALHLHMAEHGDRGAGMLIEADTIERAIEVEEWFIANTREANGLGDTGDGVSVEDAKTFVGWLRRKHADAPYQPIGLTYISRHAIPKSLRQTSHRDRAVELLVDLNYLVRVQVGKAKAVYLNPAADG